MRGCDKVLDKIWTGGRSHQWPSSQSGERVDVNTTRIIFTEDCIGFEWWPDQCCVPNVDLACPKYRFETTFETNFKTKFGIDFIWVHKIVYLIAHFEKKNINKTRI